MLTNLCLAALACFVIGLVPLGEALADEADDRLLRAARTGTFAGVDAALKEGADPDAEDHLGGHRALHHVARLGRVDAVVRLLEAGAGADRINDAGWSPLMNAVHEGHAETVRALLARGARTDATARDTGATALHLAAARGWDTILAALLAAGATVETVAHGSGNRPLHEAASASGAKASETLGLLLKAGADPNAHNNQGVTPLMMAARNGSPALAGQLLAANADPERADDTGRGALHWAAQSGAEAVVELLVAFGADADRLAFDGTSPLGAAIEGAGVAAVKVLLEAGAAIDGPVRNGRPALMEAVRLGRADLIDPLTERGADAGVRTQEDGWTVLMWAADRGLTEAIPKLVNAGADPRALSLRGETAADIADRAGHPDAAAVLKALEHAPR